MSSLLENSIIVESTKKFSVFSLEEEIERIEDNSDYFELLGSGWSKL